MYYSEADSGTNANRKWDEDKFVKLLAKFSTDDSVTVPTLAKGVRAAINEYEKNRTLLNESFYPVIPA